MESFNSAFARLRAHLPTVPRERRLAKIEILRHSIAYIRFLHYLLSLD